MNKLEQLKNYVEEELARHKITINDFEVQKKFDFRIKSADLAELLELVVCDNIHEAAALANSFVIDDTDNTDYYERKFAEEAEILKINPSEPVGIDILVF